MSLARKLKMAGNLKDKNINYLSHHNYLSSSSGTSYSFTANVSTGKSRRLVIVAMCRGGSTSLNITVDGNPATKITEFVDTDGISTNIVSYWEYEYNNSNTTADILITAPIAVNFMGSTVYSVSNMHDGYNFDTTNAQDSNPLNMDINVQNGSFLIASVREDNQSFSNVYTGVTKLHDNGWVSSGYYDSTTDETPRTVRATVGTTTYSTGKSLNIYNT